MGSCGRAPGKRRTGTEQNPPGLSRQNRADGQQKMRALLELIQPRRREHALSDGLKTQQRSPRGNRIRRDGRRGGERIMLTRLIQESRGFSEARQVAAALSGRSLFRQSAAALLLSPPVYQIGRAHV